MINCWQMLYRLIYRECLLSYRKRFELFNPLLFFMVIVSLFPLATTIDPKILALIGPGIIWTAALLATLLSLSALFYEDYIDGSIIHLMQSPQPLALLVFAKTIAHWLLFGVPLIMISPVLALLYHLDTSVIADLIVSLLLGTPFLCLVGAIGAALTVGLRNNGILLGLLVMPLYIPCLIFGASIGLIAENHQSIVGLIAILGALLILAILFAPIATAFSLRVGVNYER